MNEQEKAERALVIAEAMSWLGTPFNDQADVKGAGVDCAMLVRCVFVSTGLVAPFDPRPYPPRWHLHRDEERLLDWLVKFAAPTEEMTPGNVFVMKEGRCFSHCGIILPDNNLIHAWYRRGEVMVSPLHQTDLNFHLTGKPRPRLIFDRWAK